MTSIQEALRAVKTTPAPVASATLTCRGKAYRVSIETFTPVSAAEALKTNDKNRPISPSNVKLLTKSLERGEWNLNGETIVFDTAGRLVQGQHRLTAVVRSNVSITSFVVRGVDTEVFATFDMGKRRSASDALTLDGKNNTHALGTAARAIAIYADGELARATFTPSQALAVVKAHPLLEYWTHRFRGSPMRHFMPGAFIGLMTLFHERFGADAAETFFEQVATGEGLVKKQPAYVLREKFSKRARGVIITNGVATAAIIKAMNAFITGKEVQVLRWAEGEEMPRFVAARSA